MMALLGHWLGFSPDGATSAGSTSSSSAGAPRAQPCLAISPKKRSSSASPSAGGGPLRKTKSDELLRDFEVMRFLCRVDERVKAARPLSGADEDRLQSLHAQAAVDGCALLADIIDHLELENDKLIFRLAAGSAGPSSAAADVMRTRRNLLVC